MKPHKHAAVIHAFADGAEVQVMTDFGEWKDCQYPDFDPHCKYQVKPAAPKWPQTTMTVPELGDWFQSTQLTPSQIEVIMYGVNKAISKECQSGALVPADKVREIEAKARAEGVKEGAQQEHERIRLMAQLASPVGGQLVGYQVGNVK